MSRDYRYGHNRNKTGFQRRSQQSESGNARGRSVGKVWGVGLFVSLSFLGGFWVAQHFINNKAHGEVQPPSKIYNEVNTAQQSQSEEQTTITVEAVKPQELPKDIPEKAENVSEKRSYSFYQGLKETEVIVDAVPISVKLDDAYYIHAGTFGSEKVALREQQRLARLGQQVEVSRVQKGQRVYYRLRVGPYDDRLEMNKKRNELRQLGVDTLLVKAPKKLAVNEKNENR